MFSVNTFWIRMFMFIIIFHFLILQCFVEVHCFALPRLSSISPFCCSDVCSSRNILRCQLLGLPPRTADLPSEHWTQSVTGSDWRGNSRTNTHTHTLTTAPGCGLSHLRALVIDHDRMDQMSDLCTQKSVPYNLPGLILSWQFLHCDRNQSD